MRRLEHWNLLKREDGATLVEFALVFPVMLLFFAMIVEASRMMWSYQMAIEGVRDAARYVARTTPINICDTMGSLDITTEELRAIVEDDIDGTGVFPPVVTVNSVTADYSCEAGGYRTDPAPVVEVSANLTIDFPLGQIFSLFGDALASATTTVTDTARIYGQ